MKTLIVIVALMLCAGCIPTAAQVEIATNKTDTLMVVVDKMQEAWDALEEKGIVDSEKVKTLSAELDNAQELLTDVNEAIKSKADEGVVQQLIAANQASAPVNPYAPMIDVVLNILAGTGILGVTYGVPKIVKTVKEKNDLNFMAEELASKYKAMKRGNEKFRIDNPEKANELYNDVKEERARYGIT